MSDSLIMKTNYGIPFLNKMTNSFPAYPTILFKLTDKKDCFSLKGFVCSGECNAVTFLH